MRNIDRIIIHCSATLPGQKCDASVIEKWHIAKGYKMIGYHYVILPDGTIQTGRPESMIGAHCVNYNKTSIGICYVGGLDKKGNPCDTRTIRQKEALRSLVNAICVRYCIKDIAGHNEFSSKSCPCFDVKKEFDV